MELFVVRHAIAEDAAPDQDDADRGLTVDGKKRFARAVRGLAKLGIQFERVMHSPWKRAAQTAELLGPLLEGPTEVQPLLAEPPSAALLKALARHTEEGPLAIVGHQPWLGELVAWLAMAERDKGEWIDLKKGGVVWLEGEAKPGRMKLRACLPPSVLRAIR